MTELGPTRFAASVDRYIAHGGNPAEPVSDKSLWEVAYPVRYCREANEWLEGLVQLQQRENLLVKAIGKVSFWAVNGWASWNLRMLHGYAIEESGPDFEYRNYVALNGLRFLRSKYPGLQLDKHVTSELARLDQALPENPLFSLFKTA